jgi:amidohydrolase
MNLISAADVATAIALRRQIHAHPELGYEEEKTSELIATTLSDWGITVHRGLGKTGVVGVIQGASGQRAIGLRADMDALPISEQNTFSHASIYPKRMHACGHDGHTAMLLAAAKYLSAYRKFDGAVYLIFQPAEEGGGGAREMIKDGLFERFPMDAIFGVHNWPGIPAGQFAVRSGPIFASSNQFEVVISGRGAHAAMPQNGVDPIPVACQIVQSFQTIITRNKRPIDAAVISVTMIHAGDVTNVSPESCEIRGTVRTFSVEVLDLIERRMKEIVEGTGKAFGAKCALKFLRNYPATTNDPGETAFTRNALTDFVGIHNVTEFEPTMAAEDFGFYLLRKPGCYFLIGHGAGDHRTSGHGDGPCQLHNPSYDFNDSLIPLGASMWVTLVQAWFARGGDK